LESRGVRALDVPDQPGIRCIDVHRFRVLFERAVQTVLAPIQQWPGDALLVFRHHHRRTGAGFDRIAEITARAGIPHKYNIKRSPYWWLSSLWAYW